MAFKKLGILSLLLVGQALADQGYKKTWLSGVSELDAVEKSKISLINNQINCFYSNIFNKEFCQSIQPCLDRCSNMYKKYDTMMQADLKDSKKSKKHTSNISDALKQDKELTTLVKNMVGVYESCFRDCVDCNESLNKCMIKVMRQYFPEEIDLSQVYIDHVVFSHEYLEAQLQKKDHIVISDIAYVLEQFVYSIKKQVSFSSLFSLKKSYEMWMSFVGALEKGMKDQPKDVQRYFVGRVELAVKDFNVKSCVAVLKSMSQLRKEILKDASKGKVIDVSKIKKYEELFDKLVLILSKIASSHADKKEVDSVFASMAQKLLFNA